MATSFTVKTPSGVPAVSPGQDGFALVRIILDGSTTSTAITLPATHPMKTIKGVIGSVTVNADGIGSGVIATTGFTATHAAGTNTHALDVLLFGSGA